MRVKIADYMQEKKITNIDELFFTGDFRHAKKQAGQDSQIVAENSVAFLYEIANCIGIKDKKHIHIVPGNHDLDIESDQNSNNEILANIYNKFVVQGHFPSYILCANLLYIKVLCTTLFLRKVVKSCIY